MLSLDQARRLLDTWKFWVGVAYFGLAGCVVALFVIFGRQADETAMRVANQRIADSTAVLTCYQNADNAPSVRSILDSIDIIVSISISSLENALRKQPGSALNDQRRISLAKARIARAHLRRFRTQLVEQTPKRSKCDALANRLHLPRLPPPSPPKKPKQKEEP